MVIFLTGISSCKGSKSDSEVKTVSPETLVDSPPPLDKPPNDKPVLEVFKLSSSCVYVMLCLCLQPDELLKKISSVDGENSSVEDMSTRQKIASFPSELYNTDIIDKVTG